MADLKTDYKDDVLDTEVNELRKYQMIQNEDGTVSFVDVTEYAQVGDSFGSDILNQIVAKITTDVIDALADVLTNTEGGVLVGANAVKELKDTLQNAIDAKVTNSFTPNRAVYVDANGNLVASGTVTSTELGYLGGVTSNIQAQLNNRPTTGSEPDFHGVHLSSSKTAYVYSSDDNVNFVYKTSAGGTGYSSVRALAEDKLPKAGGTVTGKLTTQQVENSTGYAVGVNSNSYSTAPFVASAPYSSNTGSRAGYGFHNHGNNGTFLYLQTDGTLHHVNNSGQDRKIMDSSNFSYDASTQTLNITL